MNALRKLNHRICTASESVPFLTGQLSGNVKGEKVTFLCLRTSEIFKAWPVLGLRKGEY